MKDARLSLPLTEVMKIARLYISASRRASSVITKAEAWQATCSFLSPKSNPEFVYSLLCSVAGSSSSSPNFPNYSSPRKSSLVFADYLRSHFSVSRPKALRGRVRGYLSEFRCATCFEESHLSFCSPFSPLNFLRMPPTYPRPLAQTKLPIPC